MAELEIHTEGPENEKDPLGKKIGVLTALLAVFLAVVTIASHRAHTKGVLTKADANDKWSYYQAKKIKYHNLELGEDIAAMIGVKDEAGAKRVEHYKKEKERYNKEANEIEAEAKHLESEVEISEQQALRFDFGEGLIEIGLVLSSLYFISKKTYFPIIGIVAGVGGIILAATGLLV